MWGSFLNELPGSGLETQTARSLEGTLAAARTGPRRVRRREAGGCGHTRQESRAHLETAVTALPAPPAALQGLPGLPKRWVAQPLHGVQAAGTGKRWRREWGGGGDRRTRCFLTAGQDAAPPPPSLKQDPNQWTLQPSWGAGEAPSHPHS